MIVVEGDGNDEVVFGAGAASVTGGAENDLYDAIASHTGGSDVITGFKLGTDHLRLFNYDLSTVTRSVAGGNLTLQLADNTRITIVGVTQLTGASLN